jgi:hypothetical protein
LVVGLHHQRQYVTMIDQRRARDRLGGILSQIEPRKKIADPRAASGCTLPGSSCGTTPSGGLRPVWYE